MTLVHRRYGSREHWLQEPITFTSDLEGFALMLDHLFVGRPFYLRTQYDICEERARRNERHYSAARRAHLPPNLLEVIAPMIEYPRDHTLTIDDFLFAAQKDFS